LLAIGLGAAVFLVATAFDLTSLAGGRWSKRVAALGTLPLFGGALWLIFRQPPDLPLPPFSVPLGIALAILGALLVVYSLLIDLPFQRTYVAPGASTELVTTGTYALCRHPGVLWTGLLFAGLVLASRTSLMLYAAIIWYALDLLHVYVQDRYLFPGQFPDYRRYQRATPVLWPTRASVRRCWDTLPKRAGERTRVGGRDS
jgi:protein-S-isoprenylcysteine O-methyltransferase Ste14